MNTKSESRIKRIKARVKYLYNLIEEMESELEQEKKQMNPIAKSLSEKQNRPKTIPDKRRESYDRYIARKLRENWRNLDARKKILTTKPNSCHTVFVVVFNTGVNDVLRRHHHQR